jgi:hypothetical protein
LLSEYDQGDLVRIELERRIGPGNDFPAVLLLDVLADRKDPDVGEDCLSRHHFDPARLGGVLVAGKADDVDPVVRKNKSARRGIAAVVNLDRTARFPLGRIADMKPPVPALTSLSCRIGSPRMNATRVIEPLTSRGRLASPTW